MGDFMIIGVLNETKDRHETRVSLIPEVVKKILQWEQVSVLIEESAGKLAGYSDKEYEEAGTKICKEETVLSDADMIIMINYLDSYKKLKNSSIVIGQFEPYQNKNLLGELNSNNIMGISMDMVPRSTIAQKMDVLSSQASLAGYRAVVEAMNMQNKVFPMMTTPSGTITPMKVFIIGAGVAGLQAIATAKRMGASVSAFDTRAVVEEQVKSLGAKFVKVDLGDTGETKDGYAKSLTEEQLKMQQEKMAKVCTQSDVVITTAKVFGKKAPLIITDEMIKNMKDGALIIDMAVETGGNVEGSKADEIIELHGVKVYGTGKPELAVAYNASQMYANNVYAFLQMFWDKEKNSFDLEADDEILESMILTKEGKTIHKDFQ